MPSINFDFVHRQITLIQVIELTGFRLCERSVNMARTACPCRCTDSPRICSVSFAKSMWQCWRCRVGGGALDWYRHFVRKPIYEATIDLYERLGLDLPTRPHRNSLQRVREHRARKKLAKQQEGEV